MATQRRISVLSSILGSMKSVKALGVSGATMNYIDQLRGDEINASKNVRFMNAVYNASGMIQFLYHIALLVLCCMLTLLEQRTRWESLRPWLPSWCMLLLLAFRAPSWMSALRSRLLPSWHS